MVQRTQITGLGPLMPDGSRKIFDKEPKPFIATAEWLQAQSAEPDVGDYLDIAEDGAVTLVTMASLHELKPPANDRGPVPEAQKKTDGGEGSEAGLEVSPQPFKYRAKPVEVEAYEIVSVAEDKNPDGSLNVAISKGANVLASPEMLARITPQVGDYWIVQADGYVYLNPREVFLRKYEPIVE